MKYIIRTAAIGSLIAAFCVVYTWTPDSPDNTDQGLIGVMLIMIGLGLILLDEVRGIPK